MSNGFTTTNMTTTKAIASPRMRGACPRPLELATATTTARIDHARTSSTDAEANARAPISTRCMPRSVSILANTGNAVMDMETPTKRAKGQKGTDLPATWLWSS